MKLFQIEEPDGSPSDPDAPGAAVGIDLSGLVAAVAFAIGGNAVTLTDREGFELSLPVPGTPAGDWDGVLEGTRLRAERALARPVTHAVLVVGAREVEQSVRDAAEHADLSVLRVVQASELPIGETPVEAAALLAEDLVPRPEGF